MYRVLGDDKVPYDIGHIRERVTGRKLESIIMGGCGRRTGRKAIPGSGTGVLKHSFRTRAVRRG